MEADTLFEFVDSGSTNSETPLAHHFYRARFLDNKDGEGSNINLRSVLRMRVEKARVPWSNIRFELQSQRHIVFDKWLERLLVEPDGVNPFNR